MISRRNLIKTGSALMIPTLSRSIYASENEPHFFIHYSMAGGLDKTYTFDSRPLEMMEKEMQLNHLKDEPRLVKNNTGGVAYLSSVVDPLMKHFDRFSVINGVMMSSAFDGHTENANQLEGGNALGGDYYLPDITSTSPGIPLDFLKMGQGISFASVSNTGGGVNFSISAAHNLQNRLKNAMDLGAQPELLKFIQSGFEPKTMGGLAKTRLLFKESLSKSLKLQKLVSQMELPVFEPSENPLAGGNTIENDIDMILNLFKEGISRTAVYQPNSFGQDRILDAHDSETAKNSPTIIGNYIDDLDILFKKLENTPYDDSRSFFDVTTILVTTEISRTMRSMFLGNQKITESGTDHNQLSNTVIVGGKGIKGGMIIGSSDLQTAKEFQAGPSLAHLEKDQDKIKTMGRPFDFENFKERTDKPKKFIEKDYLNISSVINTLYKNFSVDENRFRKIARSEDIFPILNNLLS